VIRESLAAVAILVLVATVPGLASAASGPQWSSNVTNPSVSQGSSLVIEVMGPPNGTFTLSMNPEPFNSSQPVFTQTYQLPLTTSLPNGTAVAEVRINTTLFAVAGYQVSLYQVDGSLIGSPQIVQITPPGDTVVENELTQLSYNLAVNASRVNSLLYLQSEVKNWALFAVGWSTVWTAVLMYLMFATRTPARERRWVDKTLQFGHSLLNQPRGQSFTGAWEIKPETKPADHSVIFGAAKPQCEVCEMPHTYEGITQHLRTAHPAMRLTPESIVVLPRAASRVRESMRSERESGRASEVGRKRAAKGYDAHVDLSGAMEN
jgi:hypothetical protein